MVEVSLLSSWDGFYITVSNSGKNVGEFGPYTSKEAKACLDGMKLFALPVMVDLPDFSGEKDD